MNIAKVESLRRPKVPISLILGGLSFLYFVLIAAAISWLVWEKAIKGCYITGIRVAGIKK